jgi:membrane dipeptidase
VAAGPRIGDSGFEHNGVSPFGEQVVAELNRLGIMVDVSHARRLPCCTLADQQGTVIASHSGVRALAGTERNMDDEMMRAAARDRRRHADRGARRVRQGPPPARQAARAGAARRVRPGRDRRMARAEPEERRLRTRSSPAIERRWPSRHRQDFVDHIDYAVRLIGIDHVGISSDFDGGGGVRGWNSAAETFNVTLELVRRGYSEDEIRKLWGGNLLRVWREAERVARELQAAG